MSADLTLEECVRLADKQQCDAAFAKCDVGPGCRVFLPDDNHTHVWTLPLWTSGDNSKIPYNLWSTYWRPRSPYTNNGQGDGVWVCSNPVENYDICVSTFDACSAYVGAP